VQLDCGARGFDLRPKVVDGSLVMHHGDVIVHHPVRLNPHPSLIHLALIHLALISVSLISVSSISVSV
jgi:hypothetical protein